MIRNIVIYFGQKKNPLFTINENVSNGILWPFLFNKFIALLRGIILMIRSGNKNFIFIGRNVFIQGKKQFKYGKAVQIGNDVQVNAFGKKGLFINDHSWIGGNTYLKVSFSFNDLGDFIRIGKHVGIGEFAHLGGAGGLTIDDDCIIGPYFSCHPENHSFNEHDKLIRLQSVSRKGIHINRNCWIGAKVTILDGVIIGENCVIAAGAVVTKSMPANAVIGGVPAKVIRFRDSVDSIPLALKLVG